MSDPVDSERKLVPEGFIVLDSEWRYAFVNEQASRLMGRRADDLVGKQIWSIYPGTETQPFRLACERALRDLEPVVVESLCKDTGRLHEGRAAGVAGAWGAFVPNHIKKGESLAVVPRT
jgi:PAS domain S-box-containing protein